MVVVVVVIAMEGLASKAAVWTLSQVVLVFGPIHRSRPRYRLSLAQVPNSNG